MSKLEEIWVEVIGYPDYEVSNKGRVRSTRRNENGRILVPNGVGRDRLYPQVQLFSGDRDGSTPDYVYVSRLVAGNYLPGWSGQRLRYYDGNPSNCSVDNLYYAADGFIRDYYGSHHPDKHHEYSKVKDRASLVPF